MGWHKLFFEEMEDAKPSMKDYAKIEVDKDVMTKPKKKLHEAVAEKTNDLMKLYQEAIEAAAADIMVNQECEIHEITITPHRPSGGMILTAPNDKGYLVFIKYPTLYGFDGGAEVSIIKKKVDMKIDGELWEN